MVKYELQTEAKLRSKPSSAMMNLLNELGKRFNLTEPSFLICKMAMIKPPFRVAVRRKYKYRVSETLEYTTCLEAIPAAPGYFPLPLLSAEYFLRCIFKRQYGLMKIARGPV